MNFQEQVNKIKDLLNNAQEVLVVINKIPTLDSIASSLALYLGLKKLEKKTTVFCEDKIRVEFSNLIGVDKITDELGGKNFVISLDYKESSINKVSYNIEGDKFNLVIESRPDAPQLASENVHYSYSGAVADLIFTIETSTPGDIGKIYEEKKELFIADKIINIGHQPENENFGKVNLVVSNAASTSEIIAFLLKNLDITFDQDLATNLLAGITYGSNNFGSPKTNAITFEMAALCLRAGGTKAFPSAPRVKKKPVVFPERQLKKEEEMEEKKEEKKPSFAKASEGKEEKAPPDWLKPKIYKGSTLL